MPAQASADTPELLTIDCSSDQWSRAGGVLSFKPCSTHQGLAMHSPSGLKAIATRDEAIAQQVQAENEMLMTEAELQQAIEEVLVANMHDQEEKHKHLQASHRQQRLENESLEVVVKQQELAMTTAKRAHHRLEAQLRKYQRRPQLTRKQRQQLQILKQTGVSIEVLRRWADSNCSRLDTHGRPAGGTTVQPTPGPSPPEPTPGPSLPEPCDLFIPTQEASPGQPAARTAAYTAQQCLSTARLMMKTQVGRRRLPTCRRLFITEQCVVANTHRPGERTTVSRQLRVVYKYLRQRTLVPGSVAAGQHQRLTAQIRDVLAIVPLPCATAEAHVQAIMRELERNGLQGAHIASMTADSASMNMGGHSGVIAQLRLTALGAGIKAAIEDIASLLAQHWGELSLARSGAKPETPCDTRWASYTTAAASVIRVWRLAGEAVARVVEGQRERSPPWAVTLSGYFKDTDLLLKICVVAVVGSSLLQPELLWASQHDGLHAFELYRHVQAVQTSLSQTWTNSSQLLSDMQGQLQHLVPAQQRQQQEHQLLTYLQVHCRAMSSYYEQHVRIQNALPGLFAALGSSDLTTRWEAAQEVVSHAERMQQQHEDQQQQQEVEGQQQKRTGQRLPMCDPRVWDAHGTWEKHKKQICAMADMQALSEQDQQQLQAHLEVYYLACPISNAPVESLLQLLKHGTGMFMELPALLELMSMRTHIDAIDGVDVLDFAQRLPELRKEVRREEAAAAMARRIAKAEMKAAAATHRVGQVVVDVGDHEGQHRLSAAYALTYDGRDYSHTTVEEAEKLSVRELQAYLRFHQQELMKGWLKPKLKGLVMAHICNTVTALHGDELEAATVPEDLDSDIADRDEALQPDLTEAERKRKVSGEARAALDRDNTYHGRKCKLAHLIDHLPQELWDAFLDDAVQPRVEAISERGVLASLLLGLLVRGLFTIRVADPLGLHDQPVYTDIPVSQAAIPDLSCRNLFLQLCRGPPGNGANTRPNAAVAAVLAAHPDLRARLAAIPRHTSDSNCPMCPCRWLRPVYSEAKRSQVRGLMCSTSNNIRFYDRDVSAALNIRRGAVGPGPRPTELCYWDGRPAMPKRGRPGQEWVYVRDKALLRKWRRKWRR
ncbi:hypothetical protein QJQ45_001068 [Haematococcus lacustris]|nr:hypothetical protein QJQ45_001068 [Haematococcus lacustris]